MNYIPWPLVKKKALKSVNTTRILYARSGIRVQLWSEFYNHYVLFGFAIPGAISHSTKSRIIFGAYFLFWGFEVYMPIPEEEDDDR